MRREGGRAPRLGLRAPAREGWEVESNTPEINGERRGLLQMLFVEGNHFCPSCEKSGNCELQALAYEYEVLTPRFRHFFPDRPVDASHCGLGSAAPNPVIDTLQKFRPAYERRLVSLDFEPAFDLDAALAEARQLTGRDDRGAHLQTHEEEEK